MSDSILAAVLTIGFGFTVPIIVGLVQLGRILEKIAGIDRFIREDFAQVQLSTLHNTEDIARLRTEIAIVRTVLSIPHPPQEENNRANPHAA